MDDLPKSRRWQPDDDGDNVADSDDEDRTGASSPVLTMPKGSGDSDATIEAD